MGLIQWLFGGGAKQIGGVIEQVGGVFRPNAEASAARAHEADAAALSQYAAEFQVRQQRTWFDSLMDGLNRMVRPVITLTVLGVIPAVMLWPEQMAVAFAALALLPTGYWALVSVITGFYYGGRMQLKAQDFTRSVSDAVARAPQVIENMRRLRDHLTPGEAKNFETIPSCAENAAVAAWRTSLQIFESTK
ncbi:3TM-type holin [Leisingera sp. NJS204]|uniref:3TM-type holin n=1 Tax=Leisingera sp. NJS204 TaxID=2508307 RepID=UPI0010133099|nr:3TM-type holin [Leisingera sp. NJS204]QAX31321.1 carboxylesterase [Leisingera sp. NJS204]